MSINLHKKPLPSKELSILQSLLPRMDLSPQEKQRYETLDKGFKGEQAFHSLLQQTELKDQMFLYSLLLQTNHTEFQIDSILIRPRRIFLFEVKNFEGDYYIQQDKWYALSTGKEVRNPLHQLNRCTLLLRQALQQWGHEISVEPYIIFINPEFTLYQAPQNQPMISQPNLIDFLNN
ncbi:NERD domain-containing protein [Lederbergia sp. NSJ-179]|uniref:nuclease-related domain-containing protein n=1 Tax=Lederbergia sp. NSJ-179 TaxID=2931402 RepID=UPI001FD62485|nr:nuclease-related domain-containing protein [Lederbergia sp. NSJ-179]MCJ7842354.1 NERD domain-containing protein [Lederbergia sp. NSJ-179]